MDTLASIKVFLRIRENPELNTNGFLRVQNEHQLLYQKSIRFSNLQSNTKNDDDQLYSLDQIFHLDDHNYKIYQQTAKQMIPGLLQGQNCNILLYGQTASGKTFTMVGGSHDHKKKTKFDRQFSIQSVHSYIKNQQFNSIGILVYSLLDLFKEINKSVYNYFQQETQNLKFIIQISYFEIYNDNVYDLLRSQELLKEKLIIQEDQKTKQFQIKGLQKHQVVTMEEVFQLLTHGEKNRHFSATILNHSSSRSHALFTTELLTFEGFSSVPSRTSTMTFIDLAGCEKIESYADGKFDSDQRQNKKLGIECKAINKSLFCLTRLLQLKSQKLNNHFPYRDSVLTKIIKPTFDETSQIQIILFIKPEDEYIEQNLQTLQFGICSKQIQIQNIKKVANLQSNNHKQQEVQSQEVNDILDKLKKMIKDQPKKLLSDVKEFQHLDSIGLIYCPKFNDQSMEQTLKLSDLVFDYEGKFVLQRVRQLHEQNINLVSSLNHQINDNSNLRQHLKLSQETVRNQKTQIQEMQNYIDELEKLKSGYDCTDTITKPYQSTTSLGINFTSLINELTSTFQIEQEAEFNQQSKEINPFDEITIEVSKLLDHHEARLNNQQRCENNPKFFTKQQKKIHTNDSHQSNNTHVKLNKKVDESQSSYSRPFSQRRNKLNRLDHIVRSPLSYLSNRYSNRYEPRSLSQQNSKACVKENIKFSSEVKHNNYQKLSNLKSTSYFSSKCFQDENEEQIQIFSITPQIKNEC